MKKKNKRIYLTYEWIIPRKLNGKQTQRILILARSASLTVDTSDRFYDPCESFTYICYTPSQGLDMSSNYLDDYRRKYNYKEVMDALVRKIKRNKYKHKS